MNTKDKLNQLILKTPSGEDRNFLTELNILLNTGVGNILIEREEHFTKHKRSIEYDIKTNSLGQLREAARKLLAPHPESLVNYEPEGWDKRIWKHMCLKSYKDRLVIAGALIAAEFDRNDNLNK